MPFCSNNPLTMWYYNFLYIDFWHGSLWTNWFGKCCVFDWVNISLGWIISGLEVWPFQWARVCSGDHLWSLTRAVFWYNDSYAYVGEASAWKEWLSANRTALIAINYIICFLTVVIVLTSRSPGVLHHFWSNHK